MHRLNPPLTIIDKKGNTISITLYAGSEIQKNTENDYTISVDNMVSEQFVSGFASQEEAIKANKKIVQSLNKVELLDFSAETEQDEEPTNRYDLLLEHVLNLDKVIHEAIETLERTLPPTENLVSPHTQIARCRKSKKTIAITHIHIKEGLKLL